MAKAPDVQIIECTDRWVHLLRLQAAALKRGGLPPQTSQLEGLKVECSTVSMLCVAGALQLWCSYVAAAL